MNVRSSSILLFLLTCATLQAFNPPSGEVSSKAAASKEGTPSWVISGFRDVGREQEIEKKFMAVPDPKLAEEHLRILTQAPHIAGSAEDKATAEYVAGKFREAGLDTAIVEYKVWFNYPTEIRVDMTAPAGVEMHGPRREHVDSDPFQDDPRIVTAYNAMSASGEVEADVVYANYGSPEDFDKLKEMNVDVRGKIVIVRYGENFRGVKAFVAQERGAAGVIIYSDPKDDGYYRGDAYPKGPWRPASGVQRGSIGYMFQFPGDPTTPGIAATPSIAGCEAGCAGAVRADAEDTGYAALLCGCLADTGASRRCTASPREWQGALPFTYHVGPGPAKVHSAPEAGLSIPHDLGRDRQSAGSFFS